jgi:hypothetical protein
MYSAFDCHNVVKQTEFYLGWLRFNVTSTGNEGCLKKESYNSIPNVILWRMLWKRLKLKAYKLFIVQHLVNTHTHILAVSRKVTSS